MSIILAQKTFQHLFCKNVEKKFFNSNVQQKMFRFSPKHENFGLPFINVNILSHKLAPKTKSSITGKSSTIGKLPWIIFCKIFYFCSIYHLSLITYQLYTWYKGYNRVRRMVCPWNSEFNFFRNYSDTFTFFSLCEFSNDFSQA